MKRIAVLVVLAPLVGACALTDGSGVDPGETAEEEEGKTDSSQSSGPPAGAPSLTGWTTPGLCDDLSAVLGGPAEDSSGRIGVSGALKCFHGYGVDGVGFWGPVSAGYVGGVSKTPSVQVNGETVGSMDVVISEAAADRLFAAMSDTWSVFLPPNERVSPNGRIQCTQRTTGPSSCLVRGLVGFDTSNVYF